jgi:hypothetical protein
MTDVRLAFRECQDCGNPDVYVISRVERDIHGCELRYAEWSNCDHCKVIRMVTPWKEMGRCKSEATRSET